MRGIGVSGSTVENQDARLNDPAFQLEAPLAPTSNQGHINTQNITDIHPKIWGDFRNVYGSVKNVNGEVTMALRGNLTKCTGCVSEIMGPIPSGFQGDLHQLASRRTPVKNY